MRPMNKLLLLFAAAPLATSPGEITPAQFEEVFDLCRPPAQESAWLQVGWEIDLWKARERAAREGKPIFLWEMDGHPLGCT